MATVLVVDDELLIRVMLRDALEEAGYVVVLAENGRAAIDRAMTDRPDCILLDLMMPGLDGYETCAALKANPVLTRIPVLLISATTDVRIVDRAEGVGAAGVLPKPVSVPELLQGVALAIGDASSRDAPQGRGSGEGRVIASAMNGKETAPLEGALAPQPFEFEALLNVLERKGLLTKAEVLGEIRRLREKER